MAKLNFSKKCSFRSFSFNPCSLQFFMSMSCLIIGCLIDKQKYMLLKLAGFAQETDEHCSMLAAGMYGVSNVHRVHWALGRRVGDARPWLRSLHHSAHINMYFWVCTKPPLYTDT